MNITKDKKKYENVLDLKFQNAFDLSFGSSFFQDSNFHPLKIMKKNPNNQSKYHPIKTF